MWLKLTHSGDFEKEQFIVDMDKVKYFFPSGNDNETVLVFECKQAGMDYVKESVDEIYNMLQGGD